MQNKHDENCYDYQGDRNKDYYQPDDYDYKYDFKYFDKNSNFWRKILIKKK